MSHRKKSGLQRGLSDIVEKQTAPTPDKSQLSRGLIGKFTEPKVTLSTLGTQGTQGIHPAPMRDFQKVANSITREAVPAGVFKGKCKQIYDFLYSKTRGAIVPTRSTKLTRQAIMQGSNVGSTKTLFLNLRHLRAAGLVTWTESEGTHGGNEYTVNLPEEVMGTQSDLGYPGYPEYPEYKLPRVPMVETTQGTQGLIVDGNSTYENPNTLIKDKERFDDEAAPRPLREAERELTGKESSANAWTPLFELLSTELKIAAARTDSISSVPAFLTEHLRRRLFKASKEQMEQDSREATETPATARIDANACPDCGGTGWWYPNGTDKGVARCKHDALSAQASQT